MFNFKNTKVSKKLKDGYCARNFLSFAAKRLKFNNKCGGPGKTCF